jgi:hypothetical protein
MLGHRFQSDLCFAMKAAFAFHIKPSAARMRVLPGWRNDIVAQVVRKGQREGMFCKRHGFRRSLENIVIFSLTASGSVELNLHQQHP